MFLPNPPVDRLNSGKIIGPFAEDKLFAALLKPAIKWLRKLERANRRGFRERFTERKKRDPTFQTLDLEGSNRRVFCRWGKEFRL